MKKRAGAEPPGLAGGLTGYAIDIHDLTVLVPLRNPGPPGSTVALEIRGREGVHLRAVGRIEAGERVGDATPVRLLDVRPLHEQPQIEMESLRPSSWPPAPRERPLRVLVVDDDPSYLRAAAGAMRASGYEVIEAANGAEALSRASSRGVDLVLSDVNMPVMDGWQLLRLLRARADLRHIPVIFLTMLHNERERMRGYAQGVDDYVDKPFEVEDLMERVDRLLARACGPRDATQERALRGDLRHVSLGSLLSFLEGDRHTGVLRLSCDGARGELHIGDGFVRSVEITPDLRGDVDELTRLFHMLDWNHGDFELLSRAVEGDDEVGLPTSYILLEHARRKDGSGRAAG